MNATLITRLKDVSPEGYLTERIVWRLSKPVPPCHHAGRYRLVFVVEGARKIGFDNERGKGDHCHLDGEERPYHFGSGDQLVEDLITEVEKWKIAH